MKNRHRWFRSFASSQALAQSVFGGLAAADRLDVLARVPAECGRPAFVKADRSRLEVEVTSLGEPRPTSLDVLLEHGDYRVAVECKFTEALFGACSRPEAKPRASATVAIPGSRGGPAGAR